MHAVVSSGERYVLIGGEKEKKGENIPPNFIAFFWVIRGTLAKTTKFMFNACQHEKVCSTYF